MSSIETISVRDEGDISRGGVLPGLSLSRLVSLIGRAMERRRQRRDLMELTDRELRDIGISPAQARREAGRSFWD